MSCLQAMEYFCMGFSENRTERAMQFHAFFTLQQMAAPAAQMALTLYARGESMDCTELVPFYLRPSQAEREYERKQAQKSRE